MIIFHTANSWLTESKMKLLIHSIFHVLFIYLFTCFSRNVYLWILVESNLFHLVIFHVKTLQIDTAVKLLYSSMKCSFVDSGQKCLRSQTNFQCFDIGLISFAKLSFFLNQLVCSCDFCQLLRLVSRRPGGKSKQPPALLSFVAYWAHALQRRQCWI